MAFDFKALGKNDQLALGTGAAATVLTFIPGVFRAKAEGLGYSGSSSANAWHEIGTLGSLLILAATVLVVLRVLGNILPAGVPWNLITTAAAGLGTLLVIVFAFTAGPDINVDGFSTGPGIVGWLLFVVGIAFAVFSFLGFKDSGEQIPDFNKGNDSTPPAPPSA